MGYGFDAVAHFNFASPISNLGHLFDNNRLLAFKNIIVATNTVISIAIVKYGVYFTAYEVTLLQAIVREMALSVGLHIRPLSDYARSFPIQF